jgi:arsenite-transporting ATPase
MKEQLMRPYIFFTGKGGVGKTSLACATALSLADEGKRVLLVSTDPASNLQDVLQSPVSEKINPIKNAPGLFAININPDVSAQEYRNRVTEPLKGILSESEIKKLNEELLAHVQRRSLHLMSSPDSFQAKASILILLSLTRLRQGTH